MSNIFVMAPTAAERRSLSPGVDKKYVITPGYRALYDIKHHDIKHSDIKYLINVTQAVA